MEKYDGHLSPDRDSPLTDASQFRGASPAPTPPLTRESTSWATQRKRFPPFSSPPRCAATKTGCPPDRHVHSVMGAFGLNASILDSANLAWRLGFVAQNNARIDALLPTYSGERSLTNGHAANGHVAKRTAIKTQQADTAETGYLYDLFAGPARFHLVLFAYFDGFMLPAGGAEQRD